MLRLKRGVKMSKLETVKLPYNKTGFMQNPLLVVSEIPTKESNITLVTTKELADISTGEVERVTRVMTRKIVDTEQFAKVYLDGVGRAFDLSKTAQKLFKIILMTLEKNTDFIWLSFMGVSQIDKEMSDKTFRRAMAELVEKRFLAHAGEPNKMWTNPHLFHNGDRVQFITEYQKSQRGQRLEKKQERALSAIDELEEIGQQRLVD